MKKKKKKICPDLTLMMKIMNLIIIWLLLELKILSFVLKILKLTPRMTKREEKIDLNLYIFINIKGYTNLFVLFFCFC